MPTNITPADSWTGVIPVANDGEAANHAEKLAMAQPLADRSENNRSRLGDVPRLNTVAGVMLPLSAAQQDNAAGAAGWEMNGSGLWVAATTAAHELIIDITHLLPKAGEVIDTVTAYVNGGTGYGSLPGTMPLVGLSRTVRETGAATSFGVQVDPSGSTAAFELDHTIASTGIAHTILADTRYTVVFVSGDAGGAIADQYKLFAIEIGWTVA